MSRLIPLLAATWLVASPAIGGEVPLTQDGRPAAALVVGTRSEAAKRAAGELVQFIERISGAKLPVVQQLPDGPAIWLGIANDCPRLGEIPKLKPEGFLISCDGVKRLWLMAKDDPALGHVVHAFLEKLGCRWYMPGPIGENIPKKPTITVPAMKEVQAPGFIHRNVWWAYGGRPAWMRQLKGEWDRRNKMGGVRAHMGHNLMRIVPRAKFGEAHPEYFPMRGGMRRVPSQREDHNWQPCTTNPDVVRLAVEAARAYFDRNPTAYSFSLSPNDGYGWCQCPTCRALDPPERREDDRRGKARRMLAFANQVADGLARTHPRKFVAWYAYAGTVEAPPGPKVHPNCIISLAHYGWCGCNVHPIEDAACPLNAKFRPIVEGWSKIAHTLFAREYFTLITGPADGLARVAAGYSLAKDIRYYKKHNFVGINSESVADYGSAALNFWLAARLTWNPSANLEQLLDDYYDGMYGAAAKPMRTYFEACRDIARARGHRRAFYSDDHMARLKTLLDEARRACRTEKERARVGLVRDYFEFVTRVRAFQLNPTTGARQELRAMLEQFEKRKSLAVDFVAARSRLFGRRRAPKLVASELLRTPLKPLLDAPMPKDAAKPRASVRGAHTYLVLLKKGEELKGSVATRRLGRYFDETNYAIFGPDGKPLAQGRAPVVGGPARLSVEAPSDGLYAIVVHSGQNACRVAVANQHCVHAGGSIAFLGQTERLYFATKPSTREVTVGLETPSPGETATLILYNPEGKEVYRGDTTTRGSIVARAPARGQGIEVWSFRLTRAPKGVCEDCLITLGEGIYAYLATHPSRLLAPGKKQQPVRK